MIDSEILWHKAEVEYSAPLVPLYESSAGHEGVFVNEVVTTGSRAILENTSGDAVVDMLLERVGSLVESEGRLLPVRFGHSISRANVVRSRSPVPRRWR